jgi:hypothetical protein
MYGEEIIKFVVDSMVWANDYKYIKDEMKLYHILKLITNCIKVILYYSIETPDIVKKLNHFIFNGLLQLKIAKRL